MAKAPSSTSKSKSDVADVQLGNLPAATPKIWDDLNAFSVVARLGSFAKAGTFLGSDATALARRISHLESVLSAELLRRSSSGVAVTDVGLSVLAEAEKMEQRVRAIERIAKGEEHARPKQIVIAVSDGFAKYVLTPNIPVFRDRAPNILLSLNCTHGQANLERNQADISIGFQPYESLEILNTAIGTLRMQPFASAEYLERNGTPKSLSELKHHRLIDHSAYGLDEADWSLWNHIAADQLAFKSNLSAVHFEMVKAGVGIAMLPAYAETRDGIVALDINYELSMTVFLSYPRSLGDNRQVRAVLDWIRWIFQEEHAQWFA